jgi:hypothetical protein
MRFNNIHLRLMHVMQINCRLLKKSNPGNKYFVEKLIALKYIKYPIHEKNSIFMVIGYRNLFTSNCFHRSKITQNIQFEHGIAAGS